MANLCLGSAESLQRITLPLVRLVFIMPPVQFQKGQEVIVTYTISQSLSKNHNHENIVDTLVGAIPNTGKTLAAYHSERLKKYASID